MKKFTTLLATVASLAIGSAASATSFLYTFSGNGGLNGASGSLEATDNGNGSFTATGGTIQAFGPVASGIGTLIANPNAPAQATSPFGQFFYDDQLFPGATPLLSNSGLLFDIGGIEVNIYSDNVQGGYTIYSANAGGLIGNGDGTFALSQLPGGVPEPAAWALMVGGFGIAGAAMRRRRTTTRVTYV